jgi:hypothetical protein
MNDKTSTADAEATPAAAPDLFGSDELGQLQQILLGDHARRTTERIDTLEQALLGALSDLQAQVESDMAAVNKRIDAEAENRSKANANLVSRFEDERNNQSSAVGLLKADLDDAFERLTGSLDTASTDARLQIEAVRIELTNMIEAAQGELEERKLDRGALAALLSATATELDGS